jgi:phosphoheptose isomerase/rubrerythrin
MSEFEANPVQHHLRSLALAAARTADSVGDEVTAIAQLVIDAMERGNKIFFCGNGGSAADAQHLATEYVVRFRSDRRALPAIALTTDTSLLTAAANDLGFEQVFARQVSALGKPGDILFLHTTSGKSPNLIAAAEAARACGVITVGMLGRGGGPLRDRVDHAILVPTDEGAHAQEIQLALGHAICSIVERHAHVAAVQEVPAPADPAGTIALLHAARLEEKRQALFYRALATAAETANDEALSERLNELHADEQHHLSRLTVRLMEMGEAVADVGNEPSPAVQLQGWQDVARLRERAEIERYRTLLRRELDEKTRATIEQFMAAERGHEAELGGKWMGAEA